MRRLLSLTSPFIALALVAAMSVFVLGSGETAYAAKTCGDVDTALIACDGNSDNPIVDAMIVVINFLAVGVGLAVVGGIIWGGFTYTQANGNSQKTQEGVRIIVNAVIGLLLFIFMYAIINWLVPGGLFN